MNNAQPHSPTEWLAIRERFVSQLAAEQASMNTVRTYTSALRHFESFCISEKRAITVETIAAFVVSLPYASATKANYLAAVVRLYRFLVQTSQIMPSAAELESLRVFQRRVSRAQGERLPHLPPEDAITALLDAARAREPIRSKVESDNRRRVLARLRDIAMLEALRSTGMRVGELIGLKRGDIDARYRSARVTGKGRKMRIVFFDEAAWDALREYLTARRDGTNARLLADLPLFARHSRNAGKSVPPITTDTVRDVFHGLMQEAGIELPMTPHWLRHGFATKVLETTHDLAIVQELLGHQSPLTTRVYAKVSAANLRAAHQQTFGKQKE